MASEKPVDWIFSRDQLENTPSRKDGMDAKKELSYRQQAANLIQDMGQRLTVNQLAINTAIVYMHRFYMYHSFTSFSRYSIAPAALFLAAKVEEQPKKLEHVLKICWSCLHPDKPHLDCRSSMYLQNNQELVQNELILLQTLGFDIIVDHPHTLVVKSTQLVKASRELSQMAYFMATNSLHLTTFCLQYKPTVVAAMCVHLSCKWSNYEIPLSSDGRAYWTYIDPSITERQLDDIVKEFLEILSGCPTRLQKLKSYKPVQPGNEKDEQKDKERKQAVVQRPPSSQASSSTAVPAQPAKEKKPTMSFEEYKRMHAKPPPPASKPSPSVHAQQQHRSGHHPNQAPLTEAGVKAHSQPGARPPQTSNSSKGRPHPSASATFHVKHETQPDGFPPAKARPSADAARPPPQAPVVKQESRSDGFPQPRLGPDGANVPHQAPKKECRSDGGTPKPWPRSNAETHQPAKQERPESFARPKSEPGVGDVPDYPSHAKHEPREGAFPQSKPRHSGDVTSFHHRHGEKHHHQDRQRVAHDPQRASWPGHQAAHRNVTEFSGSKPPHGTPKKLEVHGSIPVRPDSHVARQDKRKDEAHVEPDEVLAVSKDLEGRIKSERAHQQRVAMDRVLHQRSGPAQPTPNAHHHGSVVKSEDPSRRPPHNDIKGHGGGQPPTEVNSRVVKEFLKYGCQTMADMYRKYPEKLKHYLKQKSQSVQLSEDELVLYAKVKQRQKQSQLAKRKGHQGTATAQQPNAPHASPLKMVLKVPHGEASAAGTTVAKIISSTSGSASESSPVSSRKRPHDGAPEQKQPISAKHARRADGDHHKPSHHHHHRSSRSSSGGSGGPSKYKRDHSKGHSKSSSRQPDRVDDAVFQKSLSDAMNQHHRKQQQQQQASGIPTVTLKKAANGSDGSSYFTTSSRSSSKPIIDFNPKDISATVPDDIFEDDQDSGALTASNSLVGSFPSQNSTLSSPESGEIGDDQSPPPPPPPARPHKVHKIPGLFSPSSDDASSLQRTSSGFGYHSSNENELGGPSSASFARKPVQ